MTIDWKALAEKYADPLAAIDLADFAEATAADVLKFRTDLHDGMFYAPAEAVENAVVRAEDDDEGQAASGGTSAKGRRFDFVMSTENPVGPFGDVLMVKGWQLRDFRKRGGPFLFAHNIDEILPPIGKMGSVRKVLKGKETKDVGPFLGGRAEFTPPGLNPFNDLISDAVDSGFMPGGSVGFRMLSHREPTEEELKANKKLGKFSFISESTNLVEFSSVPVGMDPDAVMQRTAALGNLEALLAAWIEEGRYEDDVVAEFRRRMLMGALATGGVVRSLPPTILGNPVCSFSFPSRTQNTEAIVPLPGGAGINIRLEDGESRTFDHLSNEDVAQIDSDGVDAEMVDDILAANRPLMDAQNSLMESQSALVDSVGELRTEINGLRAALVAAQVEIEETNAFVESLFGATDEGGDDTTATDSTDRGEGSDDPYGEIFDMPEDDLRAFLKTG